MWHIKFDNCPTIYDIIDIEFEWDDEGKPVDIQVEADKDILLTIAEKHCELGCNLEHLEDDGVALFARLDPFVSWGESDKQP